jgi:hypothetical protein
VELLGTGEAGEWSRHQIIAQVPLPVIAKGRAFSVLVSGDAEVVATRPNQVCDETTPTPPPTVAGTSADRL